MSHAEPESALVLRRARKPCGFAWQKWWSCKRHADCVTQIMEPSAVEDVLATIIDPELGLDIVSLGLVYRIECRDDAIDVDVTMTTPACPLAEHLRRQAEVAVSSAFPRAQVSIHLVWSPPWDAARMSSAAKKTLGW